MHQKNEEGLSPASAGKTKQELDQMNNEELMALYKQTGDNDIKWALAMRFQEPLRRIAMRTCGAYGGMNQLEDVIHEGLLTLLNAMDRFDPEKGVKLETYVAKRLRGIVIDLGRKQDWMPRQLRQKSSRINRAEEELSMTLGREPTDREVAEHLGLSLEEMSVKGLEWKHNVVISSMCTVFAESEVVSLVAQNKDVADIIHGLNVSVASKVGALAARLGKDHPGEYMMTGGVAKNRGIIQALEEKLGAKLYICDEAQLCGALGAALFAYEKCKGSAEETR